MAGMLVKVIKIALWNAPGGSSGPGETLGVGMEARLLSSLSICHSQQWARDDLTLNQTCILGCVLTVATEKGAVTNL